MPSLVGSEMCIRDSDEGVAHCAASGSTLAAIYDTSELAAASAAMSAAGVQKAITSASSDGSGWAWHGTERWEESGFPLNTGQVTDQREGMADHIYSLRRSESDCASSSLVYVAEPKDYEGAQAACAARGGALACVGSRAEALGTAWTGDPGEIWIADSAGGSYDTCTTSDEWGCPCISCAGASERRPFILSLIHI